MSALSYREFIAQAGLPIGQAAKEWRRLNANTPVSVIASKSSFSKDSSKKKISLTSSSVPRQNKRTSVVVSSKKKQKKTTPPQAGAIPSSSKKKSPHVRTRSILSDVVGMFFGGIALGSEQSQGVAAFRQQLDEAGDELTFNKFNKLLPYALLEGKRLHLDEESIMDALAALVQNRAFQRLTNDTMARDEIDKMLSVVAITQSSQLMHKGIYKGKSPFDNTEEKKNSSRDHDSIEEKKSIHNKNTSKEKKQVVKPKEKLDIRSLYTFASNEANRFGLRANAVSNALDELHFFQPNFHPASFTGDQALAEKDITEWMQQRKRATMQKRKD